jgi:hypothetical protein
MDIYELVEWSYAGKQPKIFALLKKCVFSEHQKAKYQNINMAISFLVKPFIKNM